MATANLAGRDPVTGESPSPHYMSLQRLQKRIQSGQAVTIVHVRQFLYDEIGIKSLFTGTGYTTDESGVSGSVACLISCSH